MVHSLVLQAAALVSSALLASVAAKSGFKGLETVSLTHPSNSSARITLFGAHVISFRTTYDPLRDVLFMSKKSNMDGVKPIRGGIPVVFPNFASPVGFDAPGHGVARISMWTVVSVEVATDIRKESVATFRLEANDVTRKMWPFDFVLEYEVKLWTTWLETTLTVHNVNPIAIEFQALFHNYIHVNNIVKDGLQISGLQGVDYFDKMTKTNHTETRESFGISSMVDSIYKNVQSDIIAHIPGGSFDQLVTVRKTGSVVREGQEPIYTPTDCVIWNPWIERAANMTDFEDDEYLYMIAIEPGKVIEQQVLEPGTSYKLNQLIMVSKGV